MLAELRRYAARHEMFAPGDRVGVAVSGGADSVCLLRLLLELRNEIGLGLSVVHFDHQLRPESQGDAEFVERLAREHDCEFYLGSGDVRTHAAAHRESIEAAARQLRYGYFDSLLKRAAFRKIATAHTQTDQAETVLMKLLRGAGAQGLAGVHPVLKREWGMVVRPLLFASRAQVEDHLRALGQHFRDDASNADVAFTRNRVRHELMPRLRESNPNADAALAQTAEILREDEAVLQSETERALPFVLMQGEPVRGGGRAAGTHTQAVLALSLEALARYPVGLQRRIVRLAVQRWCAPSLEETERILELARQSTATNKWIEIEGGIRVRRLHRELQFQQVDALESGSTKPVFKDVVAEFTGEPLQMAGLRLEARAGRASALSEALEVVLPLQVCVRPWRAGDRFFAPQTREPKKVKEHLQRLKLSAAERAIWPVLELRTGTGAEIVWVKGLPARSVRILGADSQHLGNLFIQELGE